MSQEPSIFTENEFARLEGELVQRPSALAETHEVLNVPEPLETYHAYHQDLALQQAVKAMGGAWGEAELDAFGAVTGSAQMIKHGYLANENKPLFHTHDRYGRRLDLVEYHPSYHELMASAVANGIHSQPWNDPKPGAHVVRAAKEYLQAQVEAGHGCPITMTFACIPTIQKQPNVAEQWLPKILSSQYDARNLPLEQKTGATIGMAMTEKQGGSDVRANSTKAFAIEQAGPGEAYELVGHKFFMSAPMCDGFLVLAYAEGGLSCFLVPRWRPDGTKNQLYVQRLKNKMGNVSNASSEVEFRGAFGWLIGEEGRGVANILEMVALTRFDCMVASGALMRQAVVQAIHHCSQREAFGKRLTEQPLMQNVLADLAVESDAAVMLGMRMGKALDLADQDEHEANLLRIGTAIGKYWICKRTPGHVYEAMECIGGSGVMEDCMMPRLYREAPINTIWEGSGNVQCLDVLRALSRTPESLSALFNELARGQDKDPRLAQYVESLKTELGNSENMQYRARALVEKMALALQASLLLQHGDPAVAEAFCASRLREGSGGVYGVLPDHVEVRAIIERASVQPG